MRSNKLLLASVIAVTALGLGHHLDHAIRGNKVGWPLIAELTPFTYSLSFYPVIAVGLYLFWRNKVGAGFWAVIGVVGALFVGLTHFGPLALDSPADITGPYESKIAGWIALSWLMVFLAGLGAEAAYAAYLWTRTRRSGKKSVDGLPGKMRSFASAVEQEARRREPEPGA